MKTKEAVTDVQVEINGDDINVQVGNQSYSLNMLTDIQDFMVKEGGVKWIAQALVLNLRQKKEPEAQSLIERRIDNIINGHWTTPKEKKIKECKRMPVERARLVSEYIAQNADVVASGEKSLVDVVNESFARQGMDIS